MANRFKPRDGAFATAIDQLHQQIEVYDVDSLLLELYNKVNHKTLARVDDVYRNLHFVCRGNPESTAFFDLISALLQKKEMPPPLRNTLVQHMQLPLTGGGRLRVTERGHWQVRWSVVDREPRDEEDEISLYWYRYTGDGDEFPDLTFTVPEAILETIGACAELLRRDWTLAAISMLLVALEAVLWDALATIDIFRSTPQVQYKSVDWTLKMAAKTNNLLSFTIDNPDKRVDTTLSEILRNIRSSVEEDSASDPWLDIVKQPIKVRLRASKKDATHVNLDFKGVPRELLPYLASEKIAASHDVPTQTLSNALQLIRSNAEHFPSIVDKLPSELDEILLQLRNNLVHFRADGTLAHEISLEFFDIEKPITQMHELRKQNYLFLTLLHWVVDFINEFYYRTLSGALISFDREEHPHHQRAVS